MLTTKRSLLLAATLAAFVCAGCNDTPPEDHRKVTARWGTAVLAHRAGEIDDRIDRYYKKIQQSAEKRDRGGSNARTVRQTIRNANRHLPSGDRTVSARPQTACRRVRRCRTGGTQSAESEEATDPTERCLVETPARQAASTRGLSGWQTAAKLQTEAFSKPLTDVRRGARSDTTKGSGAFAAPFTSSFVQLELV